MAKSEATGMQELRQEMIGAFLLRGLRELGLKAHVRCRRRFQFGVSGAARSGRGPQVDRLPPPSPLWWLPMWPGFGQSAQALELAEHLGCGVAVMGTAKGVIDETSPHYPGVYSGAFSRPEVRSAVEDVKRLLLLVVSPVRF